MLLSNTESIAAHRVVRHVGLVSGNVVASRMGDEVIKAALKKLEKGQDPNVLADWLGGARARAVRKMTAGAEELGANAVCGVRFEQAMLSQTAVEVLVYGTAVVAEEA